MLVNTLVSMPRAAEARRLADQVGLAISSVTWEDNGRSKNSTIGPCITDMTLMCQGMAMPVVRPPNYEDLTWDVPMEKISLMVGNAQGEPLRQVTLSTFLANVDQYLTRPADWAGPRSLLAPERDSHVLMSAQACFLPTPAKDGDKELFNVAVRHYQSRPKEPRMLVLVCTNDGTSAQVTTGGVDTLWFNAKGQACPFTAQRLGAWRVQNGRADDGSAMKDDERVKNALVVIQVPLKAQPLPKVVAKIKNTSPSGKNTFQKASTSEWWGGDDDSDDSTMKQWEQEMECASFVSLPDGGYEESAVAPMAKGSGFGGGGGAPSNSFSFGGGAMASNFWDESSPFVAKGSGFGAPSKYSFDKGDFDFWDESSTPAPVATPARSKVENAIVAVGAPIGPFRELEAHAALKLERDTRFPVRVTLQYYKATSSGTCDQAAMAEIHGQMQEARRYAERLGSLVVTPASGRTTEPAPPPVWWKDFWAVYGPLYPHFTSSSTAAAYVFKNGRFAFRGMTEVAPDVRAVLDASHPEAAAPSWNMV